jgi:hypothetical protein
MKESPMLFSAPMVRAYFAGRKTQTRRIVKHKDGDPFLMNGNFRIDYPDSQPGFALEAINENGPMGEYYPVKAPPAIPGDVIWGKETWRAGIMFDSFKPVEIYYGKLIHYEADGTTNYEYKMPMPLPGRIRQSIFMRRWMARIVTPCVSLRVERLQDISAEDAIAEGIERIPNVGMFRSFGWRDYSGGSGFFNPIDSYRTLWESINGPGSWEINPWVWVIQFSPTGEYDSKGTKTDTMHARMDERNNTGLRKTARAQGRK